MQIKSLYMPVVNYTKVAAIWLTDLVNKVYDPFELPPNYDPVSYPPSLETLFYADMQARFMQPSGEFFYQIPRPADAGDTALFQGLVTGMKILKGVDVTNELNFISTLFINGTLIRGYDTNGKPNDTTSNDSATGMLFFFYTALRWGTADIHSKSGALLRTWANNLRAHNWALCDLQGNPTQYGALENGVLTDPLRMTLLLGILAVARAYDQSFAQDYADLYEKYHSILAYPKVKLLWWDTSYDTHRAAIHTHILYWMTKDEVYRDALRRIWRITEKEQNMWVYVLCSEALPSYDSSLVRRILSTFDFNRRQLGSVESLNPDVPSVKWGNDVRSKYSLPFYRRGSQDFFWQRNMFSKDEWIAKNWPEPYHSGLDFLICGWLASRLGIKS
jgi:hypothetical protein